MITEDSMHSLFIAGGALPPGHECYSDRESDTIALNTIADGRIIYAMAPRQSGKTSLFFHLQDLLKKQGWACCYINISTLMTLQDGDWFRELWEMMAGSFEFSSTSSLCLNQLDLKRLLLANIASQQKKYRKFVIFIDEVEGILAKPFSDSFFMVIRDLCQEKYKYKNITLAFAFSGSIEPESIVQNPSLSPFNTAEKVLLRDFNFIEASLISRKLLRYGQFNPEVLNRIYSWTSGQPYLVQKICRIVEETMTSKNSSDITPDTIDAIVDKVITMLPMDDNISHIKKQIDGFRGYQLELWERLRENKQVRSTEAGSMALILTGAVCEVPDSDPPELRIRNKMYEKLFQAHLQYPPPPPPKVSRCVTWLHLSDLHYCKPDTGYDADKILRLLIDDIKGMQKEFDIQPDMLFFTGDLGKGEFSGKTDGAWQLKSQLDGANNFIDAIRTSFSIPIPRDHVFIVPGNHDVNRQHATQPLTDYLDSLDGDRGESIVNDMIKKNDESWKQYHMRLSDYNEFICNKYPHIMCDADELKVRSVYSKVVTIRGLRIGIGGFNSVWSSARESREERGKLWIGARWQHPAITGRLQDADFSIALIHHPTNWLVEIEDRWLQRRIKEDYRFCLHGHEHGSWITEDDEYNLVLSAGACYQGSRNDSGYNFVRCDFTSNAIKIWLRQYREEQLGWVPMILKNKTDNNGIRTLNNIKWMRNAAIEEKRDLPVK